MKKCKISTIILLFIWLMIFSFCFAGCKSENSCEHLYSDWIVDTDATVNNEGQQHRECIKCGETLETQIIPRRLNINQIKQVLAQSMVKVNIYDYDSKTRIRQGSGFFIDDSGTFITNAHVVKDAYYIKAEKEANSDLWLPTAKYDVDTMYSYNYYESDYAICKAQTFTSKPVTFTENIKEGETVYALGYPNDANKLSVTQGVITKMNYTGEGKKYIVNTAKIDHGSSGGILANSWGKVIGITSAAVDGEYLAIGYSDFKTAIKEPHLVAREPFEWFHSEQVIDLNSTNVTTYFNVYVKPIALPNGDVQYMVAVAIKPQYQGKKTQLNAVGLLFTVQINTDYKYQSVFMGQAGSWQTTSTSDFVYINVKTIYELGGVTSTATAKFFPYGDYKNLYYSYKCTISRASGRIIFFD